MNVIMLFFVLSLEIFSLATFVSNYPNFVNIVHDNSIINNDESEPAVLTGINDTSSFLEPIAYYIGITTIFDEVKDGILPFIPVIVWDDDPSLINTLVDVPVEPFSYYGNLQIRIRCHADGVKHIVLNADPSALTIYADLSVVTTFDQHRMMTIINQAIIHKKFQITLSDPLDVGEYFVAIRYSGKLESFNENFGYVSYKYSEDSEEKWLALTNFERGNPNSVFPCFDHDKKAKFQVKLWHDAEHTVLTNQPLKEEFDLENAAGWVCSLFHISPLMSPNELVIVVGELSVRSILVIESNYSVNILARSEVIEKLDRNSKGGKFMDINDSRELDSPLNVIVVPSRNFPHDMSYYKHVVGLWKKQLLKNSSINKNLEQPKHGNSKSGKNNKSFTRVT